MSLDLSSAVEGVRPWISTGFLGGILFAVLRFGKPIADYLIEMAKLRAQMKKDDRQGYGELIEALSKEVHELRSENAMMRREIGELHAMISGQTRGDLQARRSAQVVGLHALPAGIVPPATAAAIERMEGNGE